MSVAFCEQHPFQSLLKMQFGIAVADLEESGLGIS